MNYRFKNLTLQTKARGIKAQMGRGNFGVEQIGSQYPSPMKYASKVKMKLECNWEEEFRRSRKWILSKYATNVKYANEPSQTHAFS